MRAISRIAAACGGGLLAAVVAVGAAGAAGPHIMTGGPGMSGPHMSGPHVGSMHTAHMHMNPGHNGHDHHHRHGVAFGFSDIYLGDYGYGYAGCGYEYRRWHATGSPYWRSRYYECVE